MSQSALVGQTPISYNDKLVYKALLILSPSSINPDPKFPFGPPPPANATYQTQSPGMIIGSSFAIAFAILITGARLFVRKSRHNFGLDDFVIIPALLGCIAYLALDISQESAGCLGKHLYECTYSELAWFVEAAKINSPIFYFTVFSIKISIVLQNRRITGLTSRNWQIAHWTYLALLVCLMPICVFLNMFACSPVATTYTLQSVAEVPDPRTITCLNQNAISLATRTVHIVTDWLLLPVPLIIIYRLQMPLRKKLRLGFVFCLGLISSIATVVRNVLITQVTTDLTYDYYYIYAWDVIDIFFATAVASLPALNIFADNVMAKVKSLSLGSRSSGNSKVNIFAKVRTWGSSQRHNTSLSRGSPLTKDSKQSNESFNPVIYRQTEIELVHSLAPDGKQHYVIADDRF